MKNTPDKLILDVRGEDEAKKERIEGSLNIPFAKLASNVNSTNI
jgi:rhodanese-related sulfurtransferase